MSVRLEVEVAPGRHQPGGWVRGAVRVTEGGHSRELLVSLRYREKSPDYGYTAVEVPAPVLHTGDLETGQRFDYAIAMPADALPSQKLRHGELYWEVFATCDRPGRDAHALARVEAEPAATTASAPAAVDTSVPDPVLASAQRSAGRASKGVVVAIVAALAGLVAGAILLAHGSSGSSDSSPSIVIPAPQPPAQSAFDAYTACLANAPTPRAQDRCQQQYTRALTDGPAPAP